MGFALGEPIQILAAWLSLVKAFFPQKTIVKMHLLFCALFMSLIMDEHCVNSKTIILTLLKRTVEKGPLVATVRGEDSSVTVKQTRSQQYSGQSNDVFYETTLSWVWFQGSVPNGADSFWNSYANRWEYPCRETRCAAGYYSPSRGPYCFYAYGNRELSTSHFWVLVNKYNFESLRWKPDSYGHVPHNSIYTCPGVHLYVGKNKYGLGKVDSKNTAFFLGYAGKEYWYKYYDVRTINKDYQSQQINNVRYMKEKGTYSNRALALFTTKVTNNHCTPVKKTTTLSKTVSFEHRWELGITLSQSVGTTITLGKPEVFGISWGFSSQKTYNWKKGFTQTESVTFSETVEVDIPPNQSCEVEMEGIRMNAQIPFTATVTRYYHSGEMRSATVHGVSNNVVVAQVQTVFKRCQPIPNPNPCQS